MELKLNRVSDHTRWLGNEKYTSRRWQRGKDLWLWFVKVSSGRRESEEHGEWSSSRQVDGHRVAQGSSVFYQIGRLVFRRRFVGTLFFGENSLSPDKTWGYVPKTSRRLSYGETAVRAEKHVSGKRRFHPNHQRMNPSTHRDVLNHLFSPPF